MDLVNLSIIIVNWNSKEAVKCCLNSLSRVCQSRFILSEVIVIDNASQDDSVAFLSALSLPFDFQVIQNEQNVGFGRACNQGVFLAKGRYILLLNPDTEVFESTLEDIFTHVVSPARPDIRLWTARQVDREGNTMGSCRRLPRLRYYFSEWLFLNKLFPHTFYGHSMREWDHLTSRIVEQPMGAFYLMEKKIFEEVGGFDPDYFVYAEDADFCYKLRRAGYSAYYVAEVSFFHELNVTTEAIKDFRVFYAMQGNWIYAKKWFSWSQFCLFALMWSVGYPIIRIGCFLFMAEFKGAIFFIQGWFMCMRWVVSSQKKSYVN